MKDTWISDWLVELQAKGSHTFSLGDLENELPNYTPIATKRALNRLTKKGEIISIYKGFYLIIPPQYSSRGILPAPLFVDALMKFIKRPYYVSLLNAATFHGAGHQRPQEYFIVTSFPTLRPTEKKGIKINYISINEIPTTLVEHRNTDTGFLTISNAALTASDLIRFEKRIGGLDRVSTVLYELIEVLKPSDFNTALVRHSPDTVLQRLGYLLEFICQRKDLADALFDKMADEHIRSFRIPLKTDIPTKGHSSDNRWNVIVNTEISADI